LLAATALGLGSMWRTGDPCYDPIVKTALDLPEEALLIGFVYLGTVPDGSPATERPARNGAAHARRLTSGERPH
jgi:nitroreductase